jgi:hypothetical protein
MLKWIVLVLLLVAIVSGLSKWHDRRVVEVKLPTERVYVFQHNVRRRAALGFYQGLKPLPITGRRTENGNAHLKIGTHTFFRRVEVVPCSAGQYAITFWPEKEVEFRPAKETKTHGPVTVMTADKLPATVALRLSYAIKDIPEQLLKIMKPEAFAERAIGDVLVAVREVIGQRSSLEYATIDRQDLSDEIKSNLNGRLELRGLLLRDLWLGGITFDPQVQETIKAHFNATTWAKIPRIVAAGEAAANEVIAESVSPELLELIRAERTGNPWNHWIAHLTDMDRSGARYQR